MFFLPALFLVIKKKVLISYNIFCSLQFAIHFMVLWYYAFLCCDPRDFLFQSIFTITFKINMVLLKIYYPRVNSNNRKISPNMLKLSYCVGIKSYLFPSDCNNYTSQCTLVVYLRDLWTTFYLYWNTKLIQTRQCEMAVTCFQGLKAHCYNTWLFVHLPVNNIKWITPNENDWHVEATC